MTEEYLIFLENLSFSSFSSWWRLLVAQTSRYVQVAKAGIVQAPRHERGPPLQHLKKERGLGLLIQSSRCKMNEDLSSSPHYHHSPVTQGMSQPLSINGSKIRLSPCPRYTIFALARTKETLCTVKVIASKNAYHSRKSSTKDITRGKYAFEKTDHANHLGVPTFFNYPFKEILLVIVNVSRLCHF